MTDTPLDGAPPSPADLARRFMLATRGRLPAQPSHLAAQSSGAFLRLNRERAAVTQRALAGRLGVTKGMISLLEAGHMRLPGRLYRRYALALGADPRKFARSLLRRDKPEIYECIFGKSKPIDGDFRQAARPEMKPGKSRKN